jgi:5-methylcytosine-specific restriction endonuclease McrA
MATNEYQKAYRAAHREEMNAYYKEYYATHREAMKEYASKYRADNPEKENARSRKYSAAHREKRKSAQKKYYADNPEKAGAYAKKYRVAHPEYVGAWRRDNPEKAKAIDHKRRASKAGNGGSFSAEEWRILLTSCKNKCLRCGKECRLTADHVVPVSKGGSSNIENIQPLCGPCNSSKSTQIIDYRR